MQCVAASAQGRSRVTCAVGPDLFSASVAPQAHIFRCNYIESAIHVVPHPLPSLSLSQVMCNNTSPPNAHGRQLWDHWCIDGVLNHLLRQFLTKIKLGHRSFILCSSP